MRAGQRSSHGDGELVKTKQKDRRNISLCVGPEKKLDFLGYNSLSFQDGGISRHSGKSASSRGCDGTSAGPWKGAALEGPSCWALAPVTLVIRQGERAAEAMGSEDRAGTLCCF